MDKQDGWDGDPALDEWQPDRDRDRDRAEQPNSRAPIGPRWPGDSPDQGNSIGKPVFTGVRLLIFVSCVFAIYFIMRYDDPPTGTSKFLGIEADNWIVVGIFTVMAALGCFLNITLYPHGGGRWRN